MLFFGFLLVLYIAGVMWRMGHDSEIMNEYIRENEDRGMLGMYPYELRNNAYRRDPIVLMFVGIAIVVLILFVVL